ncbi:hypothetical protein GCM10008983_22380 [Lentibacillus halophilus]|uniref:Uncharacterized protein n=1 Tax=Lentibacillus halophilus TaxID=295065 RepID=A0ABN0ZDU9_9BACI
MLFAEPYGGRSFHIHCTSSHSLPHYVFLNKNEIKNPLSDFITNEKGVVQLLFSGPLNTQ